MNDVRPGLQPGDPPEVGRAFLRDHPGGRARRHDPRRVSNQPPDCRVFFELQIRLIDRVNPAVEPIDFTFLIFREWEDTDPGNPTRQVFRVSASDPGQRLKLFDVWKYYGRAVWRVRAMNGNGLSSPWSPMHVQDEPSFGEP